MSVNCTKDFQITVATSIPEPFAYWKMEEATNATREDAIADNDLLVNITPVTQIAGKVGNAAECSAGANSQLRLLNDTDFVYAGEGFTVCCWVYLSTYDGFPNIFYAFEIQFESGGGAPLGLYQLSLPGDAGPGPVGDVPYIISWYHDGVDLIDTTEKFAFAQWHFCRAWYDPSDLKIHLQINNGTKYESAAFAAQPAAARADIRITRSSQTGRIDELGYWKQVLSDAAATALYNGGVGRTYPFS